MQTELEKRLGVEPPKYQAEKRNKAYKWKYILVKKIAYGLGLLSLILTFLLIQSLRGLH